MAGKILVYGAALALVQCIAGCSEQNSANGSAGSVNADTRAAPAMPATHKAEDADTRLVVAFGDSLYAGYNLAQTEGLAPALERALQARGLKVRVFNAGVSGDTSAAGLQRLAFTLDGLPRKPDLVIVGLGGNDMLRGLSPAETRKNLGAILAELDRRDIDAMLTGMVAAPNLGKDYADAFNPIYPELAQSFDVPLHGFILDGVIGKRDLMLADGIHPNANGVSIIAEKLAPLVADEIEH